MTENRDQLPDWSSQQEKLEKLFDELLIEEHYSSPITFKSYFNA